MNLQFPWRRDDTDEEPEGGMEAAAGGWDEDPVEEPEPEPATEEVTLEGLDDDVRARAEAYAAKQVEAERKEREKILAGAQEMGMTVGADGRYGVSDMGKLVAKLGVEDGGRTAPQPVQAAAAAEPAPDPRPSLYEDPDGYAAWMEREMDRRAAKATAELRQENDRLKNLMYDQGARSAMNAVEQAVEQYLPMLAPALQHPDFRTLYERGLANQPPEFLSDPRNLVKIAGWVAGELDPARMPQTPAPERPRDRQGRYTPDPVYQANRDSLGAGGGRGNMPVPRETARQQPLSAEETKILQEVEKVAGRISREQMQALEYTDIGSYEAELARLQRGRPAGRR